MDTTNLTGVTLSQNDALKRISKLYEAIEDTCQQLHVCGSIRRGKTAVDDADLVAVPTDPARLLARLDNLIIGHRYNRAIYSDGKTRWGSRYRGISADGFKIEIFLADEHNKGYQMLLRTGPAAANAYIMKHLQYKSGCTFENGYVWRNGDKISIPDEQTMFRLLRLPYIKPSERTEARYRQLANRLPMLPSSELTFVEDIKPPQQLGMF